MTAAYDAAKTAASQTSVNAIPTNPLLTTDARLNNLDATVSSRSTLTAAQVWANGTRTLSSFGTLVSDIASAVWGAATRTLTAISDSAGITTLLGRIGSALTINSGKVTVGANDDKSGYGLADGAITAAKIAANALNGKGDWNTTTPPTTGQIRSAMEDDGSHLALILEDTSATLPDQLTGMSGTTFDPATDSLEMIRDRGDAAWLTATGFSTLTEAGVRNAVGLASANLDDQLGELPTAPEIKEEMESDGGHLDLILDDTHTTIPAALAAMASSTAAAVWNTLLSTMTTIGSIGKAFADWLPGASVGAPPLVPSVVTICNNAIMLAGNASPIVSISDDTRAAKLCAQFYQQAFDATLRAYTWNCATERSGELAAAPEPEFGFGFAYELPIDCLRVLAVKGDDKIRFKIESGRLLTDASPCKISYIKRIAPDDADILLREAVSARLAATIAFPLTNSTSAAKAMWELYKDKLDEAQAIDAFEGTAPQMASDDWVHSRS